MPCRKNKTGIKFIGTQFFGAYSGTIYFPEDKQYMGRTLITFIGQNFKWDKAYKINGHGTMLYRVKLDDAGKRMVVQGDFKDSLPTGICGLVFPNDTQAFGIFDQGAPVGTFRYLFNKGGKKWTATISFALDQEFGTGDKVTDSEIIRGMFDFQGREQGKCEIFDLNGQ